MWSARWEHSRLCAPLIAGTILLGAVASNAEGLGGFLGHLTSMEPRANEALSNPRIAIEVISELDRDEGVFAHFTAVSGLSRVELIDAYHMLDRMLGQLYETYRRKHDACLVSIGNGGACDYDQLEQLELRALYPLSWLRFHGAVLFNQREVRRRILKQALAGFTQSALVIVAPELVRENILGRAFCERDLGEFDRGYYPKAIADFKAVMRAGAGSAELRAAQQGLATTYAAMGQVDKAAAITSHLAHGPEGDEMQGARLFRLQELFKAEAAATDSAQRAQYHRETVSLIRSFYDTKDWPLALAAISRNVSNPEGEFGASQEPFEKYLLADLLYATHHPLPAAKYYLEAARSGNYPQAYKYAIEIYYAQGRLDLVDVPLEEVASQRHNPMADWAAYMRFKLVRTRWERRRDDAALRDRWVQRAKDYMDRFPHGRYAYEPRFRLAELTQQDGKYADAAGQYDKVKGDHFYDFAASFKSAECRYLMLAAGSNQTDAKSKAMPAAEKNALTTAAIAGFRSTISNSPSEKRRQPSERQFIDSARGRATYLLVTMLEAQPHKNYAEIAQLLDGFEAANPQMSANFDDVTRWRLQALDRTGDYARAEKEIGKLLDPGPRPPASSDFIKAIGLDLWNQAKAKMVQGDTAGAMADTKLTALTYAFFEQQVRSGKMNPKSLTGTLSILGQAYVAMNDSTRARQIFEQVVKVAPSSPDANAGLARLALADKRYKDATDLWNRVESDAAESDDLWYEARYNLAVIYAADGNLRAACGKLAQTRSEHPSLGSPEMKARWDTLQRKLCLHDAFGL